MPLGACIPYLVRRHRGMDGVDEQLTVPRADAIRGTGSRGATSPVMATEQLPLSTKQVRPNLVGICHDAVSDFDQHSTHSGSVLDVSNRIHQEVRHLGAMTVRASCSKAQSPSRTASDDFLGP
ncbi:hypothetical protein V8C26DRAFT_55422 [Trichoderma gracile]